jgi:steroid delta-isomerase-like uncharacterized protein
MGLSRTGRLAVLGALTIGLLAPVPLARVAAQEATPTAECPTTTPEENKAIVTQWFDALGSGNAEGVAALAADDIIYHDASPEAETQTGGAEDWADSRQTDYPDLTVTVDRLIAEGDLVASTQHYTGTQEGDTEDQQGLPATGVKVEWLGMANFRIECGKIAEIWTVADDLGRLERLGVITPDELQDAEPVATPSS